MKIVLVVLAVLSLLAWIIGGIYVAWWYPKTYEYSLKLADDASLPGVKAQYLNDYVQKVNEIKGRPRYVFERPDLDLEKQKVILKGLIQRFEDIAKIAPSEMAYQQGMYQLTGQEVEHQLDRVSGIFFSAKLRENPLLFFFLWWGWWLFPISAFSLAIFIYHFEE